MIELFPIPVGVYRLEREFSSEELDFMKNQEWRQNLSNVNSVDNFILNNKELSKLKLFAEEALRDYVRNTINPVDGNEFYITQSWVNVTKPEQYHLGHVHRNSLLSGVLYVNIGSVDDGIHFTDTKYKRIELLKKGMTKYNSSEYISVQTGDLILFPSELEHYVELVKSSSDRISLSFNTFVRGNIGSDELLEGLKL